MQLSKDQLDKFWSLVSVGEDDECWPWNGPVRDDGWGRARIGGNRMQAHRVVWELAHGEIPKRACILHECGNKRCCNYRHLRMTCVDTLQRFWDRVTKHDGDGCWEWQGGLNAMGYGIFYVNDKGVLAHRMAYEIHFGEIPPQCNGDETCICHKCDNPKCVRPDHLFAGTRADNNYDKIAKGRFIPVRGDRHPSAKLTDDDVKAIRRSDGSGRELSLVYGVTPETIFNVKSRRTWKHIGD